MRRWDVYKAGRYAWCAHRKGELPKAEGLFRTWREAQDYADRMSRTREVVLPRLAPHGELTVSAIWSFDSLVVHYIDASRQTVQGTLTDLARHAATLLALAEQEEQCGK